MPGNGARRREEVVGRDFNGNMELRWLALALTRKKVSRMRSKGQG